MIEPRSKKLIPFVLAVIVHIGLLAFLMVNMDWFRPAPPPPPSVDLVNAVVIDETQIKQEMKKLEEQEEKKRQAEAERQKRLEDEAKAAKRKREEEEQRLKDVEKRRQDEERKVKEAEQKKQQEERRVQELKVKREKEEKQRKEDEAKKKKAEEERKKKEAEERKKKEDAERRKKAEDEAKRLLDEQMKQEEAAMSASRQREVARLTAAYQDAIRQDVERSWRRPSSATSNMECVVAVTQIPGGEVVNANIVRCNTNDEGFRSSVVNAVYKASPLPMPQDQALFQREIEFIFSPRE